MEVNNPNLWKIIKKNANGSHNIFRQCAMFKRYKLFQKVADVIWSDNDSLGREIKGALFHPSEDGRFPFHLFQDKNTENVIMHILNRIRDKSCHNNASNLSLEENVDIFISSKTEKGNNSLNLFAKSGFKLVIDWIMNYSRPKTLKTLLLNTNKLKNNAPMVCVIYNRSDILTKYLVWLFSTPTCTKEEIKDFLHHRNVYGQSILSLVLQHETTMLVPQVLLLEQEKECHQGNNKDETMSGLTSCFMEKDLRSAEVAKTIKRVDDSYERTICGKFKNIIFIVLSACLVPILIQGCDMFFDGLVVLTYSTLLAVEANRTSTDTSANSTPMHDSSFLKSCPINSSEEFMKIPAALKTLPKFNYSLSFIIIPWVFYLIEFLLSRYLKEAVNEVNDPKKQKIYPNAS